MPRYRFEHRLSVSNSLSGGDWKLNEVPAMGDPAHMVQIGRDRRVPIGEVLRRVALRCSLGDLPPADLSVAAHAYYDQLVVVRGFT